MADLHYAYVAALQLSRHPDAVSLMPAKEPGELVPIGRVRFADGVSEQRFDFGHYFKMADDSDATVEFNQAFFVGALLGLGDALRAQSYFDHAPELELVYHLRNGVAHGNRFAFTNVGKARLTRWPAHNRDAWLKTPVPYEVTPTLAGHQVLFSYIGPAELNTVFRCVGSYLQNLGSGTNPRP
jgi:hypothetical protein